MENAWHLRKEITISLILTVGLLLVSSVYAWAQIENTVGNNTVGIEKNEETITKAVDKLDSIYDGLLAAGIIQPLPR